MYYTRSHNQHGITIRPARASDRDGLRRLAQRDSADVPAGELLVAVIADHLLAAVSVDTREAIADPFERTEEAVGMLLIRAAQLRPAPRPSLRARVLDSLRGRRSGVSPQPAGTIRALRSGVAPGRRTV